MAMPTGVAVFFFMWGSCLKGGLFYDKIMEKDKRGFL